jgi:predicted transcriptional regulator
MGTCRTAEEIAESMLSAEFTILPVVGKKKLAGTISRKNIIDALVEKGFWSAHAFRARTPR